MPMSTVSFLTELDSAYIKSFPLIYDLNGYMSKFNRHLLSVVLPIQCPCML